VQQAVRTGREVKFLGLVQVVDTHHGFNSDMYVGLWILAGILSFIMLEKMVAACEEDLDDGRADDATADATDGGGGTGNAAAIESGVGADGAPTSSSKEQGWAQPAAHVAATAAAAAAAGSLSTSLTPTPSRRRSGRRSTTPQRLGHGDGWDKTATSEWTTAKAQAPAPEETALETKVGKGTGKRSGARVGSTGEIKVKGDNDASTPEREQKRSLQQALGLGDEKIDPAGDVAFSGSVPLHTFMS
jgi:hypothetical protein